MDETRQGPAAGGERDAPNGRDGGSRQPTETHAEVGPRGFRITYDEEGNRIEWTRDTPDGQEYPVIVRRGDGSVRDEEDEHWWKVWYHRHMRLCRRLENGDLNFTDEQKRALERSKETAREIESKHGKRVLDEMSEFDWGIEYGRLSALAWVLGAEWNESMGT